MPGLRLRVLPRERWKSGRKIEVYLGDDLVPDYDQSLINTEWSAARAERAEERAERAEREARRAAKRAERERDARLKLEAELRDLKTPEMQ